MARRTQKQQIAGATVVITPQYSKTNPGSEEDLYVISFDGDEGSIEAAKELIINNLKENGQASYHQDEGNTLVFTNNGYNPDGSDKNLTKTRGTQIYDAMQAASREMPTKELLENSRTPAKENETEHDIAGVKLFVGTEKIVNGDFGEGEKYNIRFQAPNSNEATFVKKHLMSELEDMGCDTRHNVNNRSNTINFKRHTNNVLTASVEDITLNADGEAGHSQNKIVELENIQEAVKNLQDRWPASDLLQHSMRTSKATAVIHREKREHSDASDAAKTMITELNIGATLKQLIDQRGTGGNINTGGEHFDPIVEALEDTITAKLMEHMMINPSVANAVNRSTKTNHSNRG